MMSSRHSSHQLVRSPEVGVKFMSPHNNFCKEVTNWSLLKSSVRNRKPWRINGGVLLSP
jgi:hypothetical protein